MNKGITVNQLARFAEIMIAKGYGDKYILISDDDEGNGYHTLFYQFMADEKEIKSCARQGLFHDNNNPNEVVLLG